MDELIGLLARACSGVANAVLWSLKTVDDGPPMSAAPPPGPAHGPVTAIDVRLGKDRRRN